MISVRFTPVDELPSLRLRSPIYPIYRLAQPIRSMVLNYKMFTKDLSKIGKYAPVIKSQKALSVFDDNEAKAELKRFKMICNCKN